MPLAEAAARRAPLAETPRAVEPGAARTMCAHCRLEVPRGLVGDAAEAQFCCAGCRAAHAIIHEHGLDRYYALAERREAPVRPSGRSFEEFDHDAFRALYVRPTPDGLSQIDLYLEGVHCASCVWLVERVPLVVPGVVRAELNARRSLARVIWDERAVALSEVARGLDRLGYRPHPFRGVRAEAVRRDEDRAMLARIGVAGAIAANVMLASLALYSGFFGGMEREYERYFRWLSLALTTPSLLWSGRVFFASAWAAARTRTLNMDVPIAIGLAAGFARGAVNTFADAGPIYLDAVATLVFLLLAGRFLQRRGQRAAADAAELRHAHAPTIARVVEGDAVREVPAESLLPGVELDVRAGDALAADGVVVSGRSAIDASLLTGESRAASVGEGDEVFAGTINLSAPLRVRVTEAGESSRLARIMRQVEESAARRAPIVRLADRTAGWFVAVVLVLAALTLALWSGRDGSRAMDNAIALLVVTCPCALALATPLAVSMAIARASRAGIFIKGGDVLERLSTPGVMLLDKTGTLTEARTALEVWDGPDWARPLILALERGSVHPIALGFQRAWPDVGGPEAEWTHHVAGGGIEGVVEGRRVSVGSPMFVREAALERRDALAPLGGRPLTPVLVAVDGEIVACAGFGDPMRADSRDAVERLRALGWEVRILSGDAPAVVSDAARQVGLEPELSIGGASPEAKRETVERHAAGHAVVMVGDGVNDAAAIAAASVGVGVHGGAEACLATADVYLMEPGLAPLVDLVEGSTRAMRVIRRNIAFALVYNVIGATLAMTGVLNPLIAAVLMPASSLTVVLASWRARTFAERNV